jgi:membrane protein
VVKPWSTIWNLTRRTLAGVGQHEMLTRAAALAFYSALSFAPLLILLLWLVASLQPAWQQQLVGSLGSLVGARAAAAVKLVIDNAEHRPRFGSWAGWLSIAVTLISASTVFAQLQDSLNRVWNLRARPGNEVLGWLRTRMHAFGLLLTLAFLLVISFSASAVIAVFTHGDTLVWQVVELLVSLLVFGIVFAAIYKVLPDAIIDWRDALIGAGLTALLFALGKFAIGLYLDHSSVGGAYGPASSVVVLLVWVFYSAVILLVGAELTQAVAAERGSPIRPSAHAELVPSCEDKPAANDAANASRGA